MARRWLAPLVATTVVAVVVALLDSSPAGAQPAPLTSRLKAGFKKGLRT